MIEYDTEQEEIGMAAATDGGSGYIENHYGKLKLQVNSPVGILPKSGARDNMDSNITKLEEKLSLVSLKLEEFCKSLEIHDETNKLTKQDQLQEELSQMKVKK